MPIDKINNIVSFQTYKNSKPLPQEKHTPEFSFKDENFGEIIPLELIATYRGNIIVNSKIEQIKKFLEEYNISSSNDEIKQALKNYYNDFETLAQVIPQGEKIYEEFIETIGKVDFEGLEKIESFYGFGVTDPTEKAYCEHLGIDPATITTNESYEIISDLIKEYAHIISKKTPYNVFVYVDNNNLCNQIEIEKDGATIALQPMIFYNIALFKKPIGDNIIVLPHKKEDEFTYTYTTKNNLAYKVKQSNGHTIGSISKEDIDKNGQPKNLLDSEFSSGITYYIMAEKYKNEETDATQELQTQDEEELFNLDDDAIYNAGLEEILRLVQQDEYAKEYFQEGVDPNFLITCIRNGQFNNNVFEAKDRLYTIIEDNLGEESDFNSQYLEQLLYLIENEDNTFSLDAIDIIALLFLKDYKSKESFEKLNYEIAGFIKENPTENNVASLIAMAKSKKITPQDFENLFAILKLFNSKDLITAKQKLETFIKAKSADEQEYKENTKLYYSFFKNYLKI